MGERQETETMRVTIAYNGRTGDHDLHAEGCRHMAVHPRYIEVLSTVTAEATTPAGLVKEFESQNDGCGFHAAPCLRKREAS
jgi:hypothetical protein